ncbi:DUF1877 family protein [Isoptericola variabilis]|uniref:DUF1877 family protein n=1 Tax=Isoptericola variabilis TaxID=139208 RepID=UPI000316C41A|nr:DUF1877 family protein [Isoptericola variabilis]
MSVRADPEQVWELLEEEAEPPAVADALAGTTVDGLRTRFDPAALARAEIYPEIWDESDVFEAYLAPAFERLRSLYAHAAARGDWVLQAIV